MAMRLRKVFHRTQVSQPQIPRLLTLCVFFAAGIISGQIAQTAAASSELTEYLRRYAGWLAQDGAASVSFLQAAAAYLREPLAVLLFGFCTFGAAVIPLVCAWQSFTLSFAVACFAASFGSGGLLLSLAALGVRCVILLPCTLVLARWALDRALCRLRGEAPPRTGPWWLLPGCFIFLTLGAVLETTAVPGLFSYVLSRLS